MDPKTRQHLALAARNRDLARALVSGSIRPTPGEWGVVVAFYAAVHYVNAYLWEQRRVEPANHGERLARVRGERTLQACREAYRHLQHAGYLARYDVTFRLPERRAARLVRDDLGIVEATVQNALGLPRSGRS